MFVRNFFSDLLQGQQDLDDMTIGQEARIKQDAAQSRKASQFSGRYFEESTRSDINNSDSYDDDGVSEVHTEYSCSKTTSSNMNSISIRSNTSNHAGRREHRDISPRLRPLHTRSEHTSKDADSLISSCASEICIQRMAAQSRIAPWGGEEEEEAEFELVIEDDASISASASTSAGAGAGAGACRSAPVVAELGGGSNGKARSESRGKFRFVPPTSGPAASEVATGINRTRRRPSSIVRGAQTSSAAQGAINSSGSNHSTAGHRSGEGKAAAGDEAVGETYCAQFRLHCVDEEDSSASNSASASASVSAAASASRTVAFPSLPFKTKTAGTSGGSTQSSTSAAVK